MKNGVTVNHDLKKLAVGQAQLVYRGKVAPPQGTDHIEIECEIYEIDGILSVHSVCPKCRHSQWIDGRNKSVEYDKTKKALFVEPFTCPWEMTEDHQDFGFSLCRLRLAYDGNKAKDA